MRLIGRYNRQSFAKRRTCDDTDSGKSFMWQRNKRGPSSALGSPRFPYRPPAFFFARAMERQRALHTENSRFASPTLGSTFPRFVAIGFYFLSETLI
jgi:hypothetical protein